MVPRKPRELIPEIIEELDALLAQFQADEGMVDPGEWANPLMNTSTDFLRKVADLRDGVKEAAQIYPEEWFHRIDSPDLDDPDLSAWHDLADWFAENSLAAQDFGPEDTDEDGAGEG